MTALALLAASAAVAVPAAAAPAAAPAGQKVDGHVATLLEAPLHLAQPTIDAHQAAAPRTDGAVTWAFDVAPATRGKRFDLRERIDPSRPGTATGQSTYGVVFLDRPLGQTGAKVVGVVDEQINGAETGTVPTAARSAYVYATHGLNRSFRYTATASRR